MAENESGGQLSGAKSVRRTPGSMSQSDARQTYRPDIDGLRAVAVLCVVLYHLFPGKLPGGFIGVDIFFVISGYLITQIIYSGASAGRFSFLTFYAKRVRRILPALCIVLCACLLAGAFVLFDDEYRQLGLHVVGGATFSSNFVLLHEAGYFDADATSKPLLHLWSLAVEEQFYIFWPILICALSSRPRTLVYGLAIVFILSFFLNVYLVDIHPEQAFYFPLPRFWELAVGACIAVCQSIAWESPLFAGRPDRRTLVRTICSAVGCVSIALGLILLTPERAFPGWWALLPVVGAGALIYAGAETVVARRLLSAPTLVFLGLISYPLYLWHWPIIVFAEFTAGKSLALPVKAAVLVASVALAWLTYRFVELRVRPRVPLPGLNSGAPIALLLSLGVIGLVGSAVYWTHGMPSRGSAFARRWNEDYWPAPQLPGYQSNQLARSLYGGVFQRDEDFFLLPDAVSTSGAIAVIGDSHANRVAVGIDAAIENRSGVINLGRSTCLPFLDVDTVEKGRSFGCQPLMNNIVHYVAQDPKISDVVISAFYMQYLSGRSTIKYATGEHARGLSTQDIFAQSLFATAAELLASGKRVILLADVPEMNFPVFDCSDRPVRFSPRRRDCFMTLQSHLRQTAAVTRIFAEAQKSLPNLRILDPQSLLCDRDKCYVRATRGLLYLPDGNHLTYEGARLLGEWIVDNHPFSLPMNEIPIVAPGSVHAGASQPTASEAFPPPAPGKSSY
jgi:peptidoglycan/LPS O-acetylase OafA/YrhL